MLCRSGFDFDRGPDGNELPDLLDFSIGDGDATLGPVVTRLHEPEVRVLVGKAVDHDVAAGKHAKRQCMGSIFFIGIGNMKGKMKLALRVLGVDPIDASGCFVVTLLCLRPYGIASQGDALGLEERTALKQRHGALRLEHNHAISMGSGVAER